MTRTRGIIRRLTRPACLSAAVAGAMALGAAGYGIAQAGGIVVKGSPHKPASSMEVAHGNVLNHAGKPAGGVHIILEAWPPQSVIDRVKAGQHVPMRWAGSAVTNSRGRVTLRISAAAAARIKGAANRNGVLNLALHAASSNGYDWFGYARTAKARSGTAIAPSFLPSWGGHPETVTLHLKATSAKRPAFAVCPGVIDEGPLLGGTQVPVTVGGTWTTLQQSTTWMTYGANHTTKFGIGVSVPFEGGGFTAGGTVAISSGLQETFKKVTGAHSRLYRTEFDYEEYNQCGSILIQPKQWDGGKLYQAVPALKNPTNCVPEGPGLSSIHSGMATTFTGGASLENVIGIDLSAETDYSATAKINFLTTGSNTASQLCGTTGDPGSSDPGWVQLEP